MYLVALNFVMVLIKVVDFLLLYNYKFYFTTIWPVTTSLFWNLFLYILEMIQTKCRTYTNRFLYVCFKSKLGKNCMLTDVFNIFRLQMIRILDCLLHGKKLITTYPVGDCMFECHGKWSTSIIELFIWIFYVNK